MRSLEMMINMFATVMLICLISFSTMASSSEASAANLKEGFYYKWCPSAEKIVWKVVYKALRKDPGLAAGIIRLYFHDCFVRGCDASVLLKSTPQNRSEQASLPNLSLRGYEVIDKAKAKLEAACPGVVSCADTLAFAARDSTYIAGGIWYNIPAGRLDGRVSLESDVIPNLPPPIPDINSLLNFFVNKGMSLQEMVALSGAHSIGTAQCPTISTRLYSFNATHSRDPSLDKKFASFLKKKCPNGATNGVVDLDVVTPNRLDRYFYKNLNKRKGVLESDQVLATSPLTAKLVKNYADYPYRWAKDFAAAMVRLGSVDVLTGKKGEIRNKCGVVNKW